MFARDILSPAFFSDAVLVWVCSQNRLGLIKCICKFISIHFLKKLEVVCINSFLVQLLGGAICSVVFFLGRILISDSAFLLIFSLFRFSISSCLVLVCVYKFSHFSPHYQICWQIVFRSLHCLLCSQGVSCNGFSSFIILMQLSFIFNPAKVWSVLSGFLKVSS